MRPDYTRQADRQRTRLLANCWPPDPPEKRERRPDQGRRLKSSDGINDSPASTPTPAGLQDARRLDRQADLLLSLGRHRAAERLAHAATALREAT